MAVSKAVMDQGTGGPEEATVEIYVASKNLAAGDKLTVELVKLDRWPQSRVPEGCLSKLEQLDAKFVRQNIFAGEPILDGKLTKSRDSLSTELPHGYRVFDIASGGIGYIKPGDHVDVIGTFKLDGTGNVAESKTVMRNVKVFAINGITTRESDGKQTSGQATLQLQVKESQVEALTLANKLGEMRISLRPFGEETAEVAENEADNGESFVSWVHQNERDPLPEPIPAQPPQTLFAANAPTPDPLKAEAKDEPSEMLIVTPNGVARYQWSGANALPKLVTDQDKEDGKPIAQAQTQAGSPYTVGNAFSGFGGYTPTYPTSTSAPSQGAPSGSNQEQRQPPADAKSQSPNEAPKID